MKRLLFFFIFLSSQFAFANDVFDNVTPRQFNLADPLAANATIGGYPIWRGEGKWRLFDIVRSDSTGSGSSIPLGAVHLFQTEGKKFVATMVVRTTLGGGNTRWLGEPCKREDLLYKANIGRSMWEDNCVTVNHIVGFFSDPSGKYAELYALFREQGIEIPPTVLRIDWTRNGNMGNYYRVSLTINPELLGFEKDTELGWGRNSWHKSTSFNNPAKIGHYSLPSKWIARSIKSKMHS